MDPPYIRIPVPPDLRPLSLADLTPPQDPYNFVPPDAIIDPPECSLDRAFARHYSPVYSIVRTPPDLSPHLNDENGGPLYTMPMPHPPTSYIQDDSEEVEAAIIAAHIAAGADLSRWEQPANRPGPNDEPNAPPPSYTPYPVANPQQLVQPIHPPHPPPDEVGLSGSTVSGLPLPPLRSPSRMSGAAAPHLARSYAHTPASSSSSALGLQPIPPTSLGNNNNPNALLLLPHVQPQYARLSEREAAAVEREAAALRVSQSHGHTGQSEEPHQQRNNAWANNQTLAQVGQPPHLPGQSVSPTGYSQPRINTSSTPPTSSTHMDPTTTPLQPAVFSSPSPDSDPAAPPPPRSATASNLSSRNTSRQVTGDSTSTEVPIAIDPIAGCKRTAEEAFAGDGALDSSGSEEDVDMVDQLMEENDPGVGIGGGGGGGTEAEAEAEAGEGEHEHDNLAVFILEDGQRPPPKRRKLTDASSTTLNANRAFNIRLPPPPSLAGSSRPPVAPTPEMMHTQLDTDPTTSPPLATVPIDATLASANLPPPVLMFQRDPDAPPNYADWVRENQPDAEVERWMECTRRNLAYDPSAVPAPPEGFESGKDRKKDSEGGEGASGEKGGEGEGEGEGEASVEREELKENEGNTKESAAEGGKSKPYEINESTPPNVNEGLWCLFDYPKTIKPKYSYAFMARVAILGSPTRRLQLQDIYVMIEAKFPFYRDGNHVSWKVRVAIFFTPFKGDRLMHMRGRCRTRSDTTSAPTSGLSSVSGTWSMNQGIALCGRWIQPRKGVSYLLPSTLVILLFKLTPAFCRPKEEARATRS